MTFTNVIYDFEDANNLLGHIIITINIVYS